MHKIKNNLHQLSSIRRRLYRFQINQFCPFSASSIFVTISLSFLLHCWSFYLPTSRFFFIFYGSEIFVVWVAVRVFAVHLPLLFPWCLVLIVCDWLNSVRNSGRLCEQSVLRLARRIRNPVLVDIFVWWRKFGDKQTTIWSQLPLWSFTWLVRLTGENLEGKLIQLLTVCFVVRRENSVCSF